MNYTVCNISVGNDWMQIHRSDCQDLRRMSRRINNMWTAEADSAETVRMLELEEFLACDMEVVESDIRIMECAR